MKRGQKYRKTKIFSDFFMTRKGVKKKKDCPMLKHIGNSLFSNGAPL
jgi:hypothetical protein